MTAEMGEYLVGAWFEIIEQCDVVSYNVRSPEKGIKALGEFDILALNFKTNTATLCEVATHILGFLYGNRSEDSIDRIKEKLQRQQYYAKKYLRNFDSIRFQFWSPIVTRKNVEELKKIKGLEAIINEEYTARIIQLKKEAKQLTKKVQNPAFRLLQILEHLRNKV